MEPKQVLGIAAVGGVGLAVVFGPGVVRWAQMKGKIAQLESEIAHLRKENQRLFQEARRLREDPSYAEEVARREFGFVRPGETVIKFKGPQKPSKK